MFDRQVIVDWSASNSPKTGKCPNPGDVTSCGDIFAIHPEGTGLRKLTDGSQTYCLTPVSSDGHVFFSSDRRDPGGESDLWVMSSDGSGATLVAAIPGNEQDGTFLPPTR